MPLAGTTPSVAIGPNDRHYMFDGSEIPAANVTSQTIARAGLGNDPFTFAIDFGAVPAATVQVQASNSDIPANFQMVFTSTSKQHDFFSDANTSWEFYRIVLSAYTSGGMPVVRVRR